MLRTPRRGSTLGEMTRGPTHVAAFGIHRHPDLNLHRPHAELCSKRTALALLCVAQFMVVLDVSIVNVALPSIRSQLHVSDTSLQWIVNAYALAFGGFLLLGGRAADLLGRRRVFIAGIGLFSGASLLGGLSDSIGMLTAARALQGLGAAVVSPATLAILTTTFSDPEERRRAMGVWGAVAGAGGAAGVLLGGVLTDLLSWPWILFVNVPIGAGVMLVALRAIRSEPPLERTSFDLAGAVVATAGIVAIVLGIVRSQTWGFGSARMLAVFLGGIALLVWFVVQESRLAAHPLVPLRVFANRSLSAANVVMFLVGCSMFAAFFFLTLYLQQVRGYSALQAGAVFLPMALGIVTGSVLATKLTGSLGPKPPLVTGLGLSASGMLQLTGLSVHGSLITTVLVPEVALGLGLGLAFVPVTIAAVAGVAPVEAGLASGLINMSRSVGGSVGLAALATIATSRTSQLLHGRSPSPHVVHAALTGGFARGFVVGAALAIAAATTAMVALPGRPRRPSTPDPRAVEVVA